MPKGIYARRKAPQSTAHHAHLWSSGRGKDIPIPEATETLFDEAVARLGLQLQPDMWPRSEQLRQFAKRNRRTHYIPEYLLIHWGLADRDAEVA